MSSHLKRFSYFFALAVTLSITSTVLPDSDSTHDESSVANYRGAFSTPALRITHLMPEPAN